MKNLIRLAQVWKNKVGLRRISRMPLTERIDWSTEPRYCLNFPPGQASTQGTILALGIWEPGVVSEMRHNWLMGCNWWSQGKDSTRGQSWACASQRVPLKCQVKETGKRSRNNQVLGSGTGTGAPGQDKQFLMTGGRQSLRISQGTGVSSQRNFMGAV